jgi:predicted flap endonuclease-1-like 5' DNA nuclease
MGIVSFAQVAGLTRDDIERTNEMLSFKGRIEPRGWIGPALRSIV